MRHNVKIRNTVNASTDTFGCFQAIVGIILPSFGPAHILCSMINEDLSYHLPYTLDLHH